MSEAPAPPARRATSSRWRDRRVLLGGLLVAVSVFGGARLAVTADRSVPVWSVSTDLAAGTTLTSADLQVRRVHLEGTSETYTPASHPIVGWLLQRSLDAGELIPVGAAVAPDAAPDGRLVTVPVDRLHLPIDLTRGARVDVYVTPDSAGVSSVGEPRKVLPDATVVDVDDGSSGFGGQSQQIGVVLWVSPADVAALVQALRQGAVDLVRVPQDTAVAATASLG